jgi:PAS domain S-box-containing protein
MAGCVDFVLPPARIAEELSHIIRHPYVGLSTVEKADPLPAEKGDEWDRLFKLLRDASGVDFTFYKEPTIKRRVARRMAVRKVERLGQYLKYLGSHGEELDALYNDILIDVTRFFRDPDVFRALKNRIFTQLLKRKSAGDPIRIWAPGCSSGEEVYSIAICLLENLRDRLRSTPIQIFGSDISGQAIEKARVGVYQKNALQTVSQARLRRFFTQVNGNYRINSAVRDLCLFSRHDVTKDPPFSRLDLISCRNVLIYLGPVLQKKVLASFHYALRDTGVLLLGKSESLAAFRDLFTIADGKNKFFIKKARAMVAPDTRSATFGRLTAPGKPYLQTPPGFDLEKEADRVIWERSHHAGLVVDNDLQILHFRGDTSSYLRPVPGRATFQLLRMLREELVLELRGLVNKARKTSGSVRREAVRVRRNGEVHYINIEIRPLSSRRSDGSYFLILFEEVGLPTQEQTKRATGRRRKDVDDRRWREGNEPTPSREYLQAFIQEQETTNEELQRANEEAQSSQEELQSINEELETAQEELQSTNEELVTLNEQLQKRNTELSHLSDELNNVLTGVDIPILILGLDLCIRRFTPAAEKLLHLLPGDVGRSIGRIRTGFNLQDLNESISQIVKGEHDVWRDVKAEDGRWHSIRILPFLTAERKIDGVLIAFVDVDILKQTQQRSQREEKVVTSILDTAKDLLIITLDRKGRILQFNRAAQELTGYSLKEVKGKRLWDFLSIREERAQVKSSFEEVLKGGTAQGETHWLTKRGQPRLIAWNNTVAVSDDSAVDYVIHTGVDVTNREEAQEHARESEATMRALLETAAQAIVAVDGNGRIALVNAAAETVFGYTRRELVGQPMEILVPERLRATHAGNRSAYLLQPRTRPMGIGLNLSGIRKDGSEFPVEVSSSYVETKGGMLSVAFISDITERKRNETTLLEYQKELQTLTARLLAIQEAGNKELARELHDALSQKLAALAMEVSTLLQSTSKSPESLPERVRALSTRINGLAEDVHAMSRRLHPAILDELGLEAALREECLGFSTQEGVPVQFGSEGVPSSLPEGISLCLYRVAQESLRNIAKHAKAANVRIVLSRKQDGIGLRVEDTGDGFDVNEAKKKGGLGLISMEERVRLVNGKFSIQSKPGDGTIVEVFVPLGSKGNETVETASG